MSASKDKKQRKGQREQGIDLRSAAEIKEGQKKKRQKLALSIAGGLFAVFVVFVLVVNTSLFHRSATAVKANDRSYSIAEFNYFYNSAYFNYMSSGYGYLYIDTSLPLSSQTYALGSDENYSWHDYFNDQALDSMQSIAMLVSQAAAAGVTELDEEHQTTLEENVESINTDLEASDYSTLSSYLSTYYGRGVTIEVVRLLMEEALLAEQYSSQVQDEMTAGYSDSDLETHYTENQDDFDRYTYRYYSVPSTEDETAGIDAETGMAAAAETAEEIAGKITSEEDFISVAYEYGGEEYVEETATLAEGIAGSSLMETYAEWMKDASRTEGDTTTIAGDSEYYVLYYIGRDGNEINLVNARHILIEPEAVETSDDMTTEEQESLETAAKEAALAKAEEIYAEWQAGDATEESLAALAEEYSSDTGSNTDGGLYEDIVPGQMATEFNEWVFDGAREPGDAEIVETESYGYHIVYFVGESEQTYRQYLGEQSMLEADYTAWEDGISASFTARKTFFFRFTVS